MLGYADVYEAADDVTRITPFQPTALEGSDYRMYQNIEKKGGPNRRFLGMMPEGKGWLMAEFGADKKEDALETAHRVMEMLKSRAGAPSMKLFTEKEDMAHLWEIREAGLGATAFVPGRARHVAGMGRFSSGAGKAWRIPARSSCAVSEV